MAFWTCDVPVWHQRVGPWGNMGRFTELHWHHEVIHNSVAIHPSKVLAEWAMF
jgi:hypothetical protein